MADLTGRIEAGAELKASIEPHELAINVTIVGSGPPGKKGKDADIAAAEAATEAATDAAGAANRAVSYAAEAAEGALAAKEYAEGAGASAMEKAAAAGSAADKANNAAGAATAAAEDLALRVSSGEFDGKDGYTPVKGVDYTDGYTPVKGVDYTDGYTPVRGTDYWTDEDKSEIIQSTKDSIDIPYANDKTAGVVIIKGRSGSGMEIGADGVLKSYSADNATITSRGSSRMQLSPSNMDFAVKAAMTDGKGNAWTEEEKTAGRARMGAVSSDDVAGMLNALGEPMLSKTYDDIRYSPTVIYNASYTYVKFGEIKPINYDRPCSITLRLKVEVNNTDGNVPIAVYGEYLVRLHFAQDVVSSTNLTPRYKYLGFEAYNKFPSTSYRPLYTFGTRGLNDKGFTAGNTIPFGWVRGSNEYKYNTCTRNITVDLMECTNCTATIVDELTHTNANGFIGDGVLGNYDTITSINDLGTVGDRHTGDLNSDTYTRLSDNAQKQISDYTVYRYSLLLEKMDGTYAPLHTNNKSNTTANGGIAVPNTTSAFKIGGRILCYTSTITLAVGAFTMSGDIEYTCDGRYLSTNKAGNAMKIDGVALTATNAKALYLKVKDNGDLTFSLDSNLPADIGYHLTQTLPTTDDGYLYIQIGRMANHLYQYRLTAEHDIYYHDGTRLRRY